MLKVVGWVEKFVVGALVILLMLTIVMGTLELGSIVVTEIIEPPYFRIEISRLYEMFSIFLIVLIGLELMRSVKSYIVHGEIKPEIVVEAAIIAIGNKLITLEIKQIAPEMLVGLAATLLGLAVLYFVLRKTGAP
ncbi:MAG: phosphate-starvation-inducible PsiE family protein [Burkholderiales bacterium]